jgi:hypothetical protein
MLPGLQKRDRRNIRQGDAGGRTVKHEALFTWLLILACLFHYSAVLLPVAGSVFDAIAVVMCFGLIVEIVRHVELSEARA